MPSSSCSYLVSLVKISSGEFEKREVMNLSLLSVCSMSVLGMKIRYKITM